MSSSGGAGVVSGASHAQHIRLSTETDTKALIALYDEVFGYYTGARNEARGVVERKLACNDGLFWVVGAAQGTIMAGYDGHRGWIYRLAVNPGCRRQGVGSALVRTAETALRSLGCPKINLQVRSDNVAVVRFWKRMGYIVEPRTSLGKTLT